jgi:hypothetical protein
MTKEQKEKSGSANEIYISRFELARHQKAMRKLKEEIKKEKDEQTK